MAQDDNNPDTPNENNTENTNDDLPELDPITAESLQAELRRYQQAYKEEFDQAQEAHPEQTIDNTLEFFKNNVPMACAQIVWLMENSTSDSTRLASSKYVIDRVFKGMVDSPEDPVRDILAALMKGETPAPTE